MYEQRYAEGYDIHEREYKAWLKITHPTDAKSEPRSDASVKSTSSLPYSVPSGVHSSSGSLDILREMLVLPQPKERSRKRKKAVNSNAICITDLEVLEELKAKEAKLEEEEAKERKKKENRKKKQNAALEMERRKENSLKQKKEQLKTDHKHDPKLCCRPR